MELTEGLKHTSRLVVTEVHTAIAAGSGDMPVLATPMMLALMENAAMLAVAPALGEDETTVGGHIASSHLAPSPIGAEVEATAVLERVEGRKLYFSVTAREGDRLVGEGTHLRFVVSRTRLLSKLYPHSGSKSRHPLFEGT